MLPNYRTSVDFMSQELRRFPWENKEAYAEFLAQTYYYVCHSVRLLACAAGRFSQEDQALHRRFLKHTEEENSHELLALRDLQKLGFKISDFPELPVTKTMYETQYYKIEHIDPVALMGYILPLETMAGRDFKWLKEKTYGLYGAEAAKFIQVHADDDPDHIEKALKVIESLKAHRLPEIDANIVQSAKAYSDMLRACEEKAMSKGIRKAA